MKLEYTTTRKNLTFLPTGQMQATYSEYTTEKLMNENIIVNGQSFVNPGALLRVTPANKQ